MPTTLATGRYAAGLIGVGTLINLLVQDVDGAFVVPDLLVGVALVIGALLPARQAVPTLTAAFGAASGVFTVAAFSYFERNEVGYGVLLFDLTCLTMTALFSARRGLSQHGVPAEG